MSTKTGGIIKNIYLALIVLLSVIRVWLSSNMNLLIVVKGGAYDDWLQVRNAVEILNGNWLGKYSKSILVKNISYPVFLALNSFFHIPYGIGYAAFIIITAIIFIKAINSLIQNIYLKGIIYLLIIYQPIALLSASAIRIYRNRRMYC